MKCKFFICVLFFLFLGRVVFGEEKLPSDAMKFLQSAADESYKQSFAATTNRPMGNMIFFEPEATYYHRADSEDGQKYSVRIEQTYAANTTLAGKKVVFIWGPEGAYVIFPDGTNVKMEKSFLKKPHVLNDYLTPFMAKRFYDFQITNPAVKHDGISCWEVTMKKVKPEMGGYEVIKYFVGKNDNFIYKVDCYNKDGKLDDIRQFYHPNFTDVRKEKFPESFFKPVDGATIVNVSSPKELNKYMFPEQASVDKNKAGFVEQGYHFLIDTMIGKIILIFVGLILIVVAVGFFRRKRTV